MTSEQYKVFCKDYAEKRTKVLQLYQEGIAVIRIVQAVHMDKRTIKKIIEEALANGEVKYTKFVRSDKGKEPNTVRTRAQKAAELKRQVRYANICDLYRQGYTYYDIAEKLKTSFTTVKRSIDSAISSGDINALDTARARELKSQRRKAKMQETISKKKKKDVSEYPAPTLAPGETVYCDLKISHKCVYGTKSDDPNVQKCRYGLITGKCRSVGEGGCSWRACTKFSRISKTNKWIKIEGEEWAQSVT